MPALVQIVPVNEIGERSLNPLAWRGQDLSGKGARPRRYAHRAVAELAKAFPVEPGRGGARSRQPVEHDVVEHLVHRQHIPGRTLVIGPVVHFLEHPCRQRGGRIHQAIADRLRTRALLLGIARIPFLIEPEALQRLEHLGVLALHIIRSRTADWHVEVDAPALGRGQLPDRHRDCRAPVPALRHPAPVFQPLHQFGPGLRDPFHPPSRSPGLGGKAVAGQRRGDDMERLRVCHSRLGQFVDHAEEFDHRTGPAMRQQQRHGIGARRGLVQEVDIQPIDLGDELPDRIQPRLASPPVVTGPPIGDQLPKRGKRCALRPVVDRCRFGPARAIEARCQIR